MATVDAAREPAPAAGTTAVPTDQVCAFFVVTRNPSTHPPAPTRTRTRTRTRARLKRKRKTVVEIPLKRVRKKEIKRARGQL